MIKIKYLKTKPFGFGVVGFIVFFIYLVHQAGAGHNWFGIPVENDSEAERASIQREKIADELGSFFKLNLYPEKFEFEWDGKFENWNIEYSINQDLQDRAQNLLSRYKPDYAAIVVMNAHTGQILALTSFEKQAKSPRNWSLHGQFPAASLFKVVTASAAVDKYGLSPDTLILFNGGSHTLYKKNVMDSKINRWTRKTTLQEAFAKSFNVPFGLLTFDRMEPSDIEQYALKFGFNQKIKSDLPIDTGFTQIPNEKNFKLAEIASGFNKVTRMSPVQGAMISASVASGGMMPVPWIVKKIKDDKGEIVYESRPVTAATVLTEQGAERVNQLMQATIKQGTSRKTFRPLMPKLKLSEIIVGGKTGSLTGDSPKGKVDWFIGYAMGADDEKIAIAAITVNKTKWVVKSSYLARQMIEDHFKEDLLPKRKVASLRRK